MSTARERHPQVFVERHEDTRQRQRTVPMEVLSMGFSRTGTMSMKAAFEILGLPTWHYVTQTENPPDLAMWSDALSAKFVPESGMKPFGRAQFDNLLGHWSAVTDTPASFFADELIAAYPEAKVVLVERDVDRWYKSYCEGVIDSNASPFIPLASMIDKMYIGQMRKQMDLIVKYVFNVPVERAHGLINNPEWFSDWRSKAKDVYIQHNENVKRITSKDRLLLFKIEDGWEPLCQFLGKPVPDVPFPRVNETAAVQEKVNLYIAESYKRTAIRFGKKAVPWVAGIGVGLAWWIWR